MATITLRPMEFGEILDNAIELYRRDLATFLGIYAVATVPYVAVSTPLSLRSLVVTPQPGEPLAADLGPMLGTAAASLALLVFYTVVISPMVTGALTIAVSERYLGRPVSLGSAYRRVLRRFWPLVGSLALVTAPMLAALFAVMIAVIVAVVAGTFWLGGDADLARVTAIAVALCVPILLLVVLLFLVWFGFVPAAVVLEGRGLGSVRRSVELVRGRFKRVFGLFLVLFLMVIIMAAYLRLPSQLLAGTAGLGGEAGTALLGSLAMQAGILFVDPVRMVGVTLIYYDVRIRHEGFDLALLADELGGDRTPAKGG